MKTKKIYLNGKKSKYCLVRLFDKKKDMQKAYKESCPTDKNHDKTLGAHHAYEAIIVEKGKRDRLSPETGTLFCSLENCGAGVISHELMHAIFWARGHKFMKKQYPIIVQNMKEEEELLHNFTYAIIQFYNWYWRINKISPKKKVNKKK